MQLIEYFSRAEGITLTISIAGKSHKIKEIIVYASLVEFVVSCVCLNVPPLAFPSSKMQPEG